MADLIWLSTVMTKMIKLHVLLLKKLPDIMYCDDENDQITEDNQLLVAASKTHVTRLPTFIMRINFSSILPSIPECVNLPASHL